MKIQKVYVSLFAILFTLGIGKYLVKAESYRDSPLITKEHHPEESAESKAFSIKPSVTDENSIKVALLLDTSGSMNGLIEQAKSQLWQILNQLAGTQRTDGQDTRLEIALYEYGNPSRTDSRDKQIKQLSPFTSDMDLISKELFSLTTNGGEEYCGQTIWTSLTELAWGENIKDLKMIYIAGNEPFTQGPVQFSTACQKASDNDIVINTIFCGNWDEGVRTSWKEGADIGKGEYMNIDHNKKTTYVETPFDKEISELNTRLNNTYIPYGKKGAEKSHNQKQQDSNAGSYSLANMADRAVFKSSKKYKAEDWDLIDAYKKDKNVLNNKKALPDDLQALSMDALEAKIQKIIAERDQIKESIQDNNILREKYIRDNSDLVDEDKTLKNSIKKSIEKHAKKKGYALDKN